MGKIYIIFEGFEEFSVSSLFFTSFRAFKQDVIFLINFMASNRACSLFFWGSNILFRSECSSLHNTKIYHIFHFESSYRNKLSILSKVFTGR